MAEVLNESAQRIGRLDVPERDALNDEIAQLVERHGGDNWIRALSLNAETTRRFTHYFEQLFSVPNGLLPIAERELIAVIVSRTNGCGLCTIHHTHALGAVLDDRVKARRIALDYHLAGLSPRELALAHLAQTLTLSPREIRTEDLDALRAVGLDDAQILEAIETASWFNHTNRIFIATGVVPDEKYFAGIA
jgi:uncharacterized peroxidase-related enzyme